MNNDTMPNQYNITILSIEHQFQNLIQISTGYNLLHVSTGLKFHHYKSKANQIVSTCLKFSHNPTSKEQVQKKSASNYYTYKHATCHTSIWCLQAGRTTPSSMLLHYFLLQSQVVVTVPRYNFVDVYANDPLFLLELLGSS
jgi:hypothetical protein